MNKTVLLISLTNDQNNNASSSISPSIRILSRHPIKCKISGPWTLEPEAFINIKCKSAFYNPRNISRVRKPLTTMAVITIIQAFVTSKLDYCSCLLYGSPIILLIVCKKSRTTLHVSSRILDELNVHSWAFHGINFWIIRFCVVFLSVWLSELFARCLN